MNSLPSSLYTAALALCLFSASLLRARKNYTGRPLAYFTAFLTIESLGFVFELLMAHPATPLKALWLGLRMGSSLLIAPCLWLATREIVEGVPPKWSSLHWRHFVPILAGIAFTLPLIETAHWGTDYYNPNRITSPLHSRVIHGTMLLCVAVFAGQVPFYLLKCRRLLLARHASQRSSNQMDGDGSAAWLHLPLIIVFTTWILGLLRTVQCASHAPQGFIALFALIEVSVTVAAIYSIFRRTSPLEIPASDRPLETSSSLIAFSATTPDAISAIPVALPLASNSPAAEGITETKYAKSSLPPAVRERIKSKLRTALATEELYRDSLINLRSLSSSIKEKAHYVSQVINQELNSSFYQLVNQYRIEEAKKLLADSSAQTVLEIALAVGFNSKSTFHTAFRRNTGTTPSEYRSSHGR